LTTRISSRQTLGEFTVLYYTLKIVVSALVILAVSELAKRHSAVAALLDAHRGCFRSVDWRFVHPDLLAVPAAVGGGHAAVLAQNGGRFEFWWPKRKRRSRSGCSVGEAHVSGCAVSAHWVARVTLV
jgi:hypothetical protein